MYYNQDEFLLLSRTGRVARSGAGPPRPLYVPGEALPDRSPGAPWLLRAVGAALSGMWRHTRDGRTPGPAGPPDAETAAFENYLELEFAVGFGAEDEPWL